MATVVELSTTELNLADLFERLGPMPLSRIRFQPPPGTATEDDVVEANGVLCELLDGILVEKTVGAYESYLAAVLIELLNSFVRSNKLGIVLGEQGSVRLAPQLVRIPDVSFFSSEALPEGRFPREPFPLLIPTLAVEVLSKSNTKREMQRKLEDYFAVGVQEVWFIDPPTKELRIYEPSTQPDLAAPALVMKSSTKLVGRAVLPGFELEVSQIFAEPLEK